MSTKYRVFERLKARPLLVWRIITYIILGFMAGSIIGSTYFIYTHIYQTLDSANAIVVLNSNMGSSILDLRAYQQAKAQLDTKLAVPLPAPQVRNVFQYTATTTPFTSFEPATTTTSTPAVKPTSSPTTTATTSAAIITPSVSSSVHAPTSP